MKAYIWITALAALVLAGCAKENTEPVQNAAATDGVPVKITASLGKGFDTGTEIVPMSRAAGDVKFKVYNNYKCLFLKDMGDKWVVDQVVTPEFRVGQDVKSWETVDVAEGDTADPFEVTLRPGTYKMLVVFNTTAGKWNPDLVPGYVIERDEHGDWPYAITYKTENHRDNPYANNGNLTICNDIFAEVHDFSISKTDTVAQDKYSRDIELETKRRVGKFRVVLRKKDGYTGTFLAPVYTSSIFYTLSTTTSKNFCQGIDVWGDAWYDSDAPLTSIKVTQGTDTKLNHWQMGADGKQYLLSTYQGRTHNPYYFVDPKDSEGTPIQMTDFKYNFISQQPHLIYPWPVQGVIINNTITGVILQPEALTDEVYYDMSTEFPDGYGWLEEVTDSQYSAGELFEPFAEYNVQ